MLILFHKFNIKEEVWEFPNIKHLSHTAVGVGGSGYKFLFAMSFHLDLCYLMLN